MRDFVSRAEVNQADRELEDRQKEIDQYREKEQERFWEEAKQENPDFSDFNYEDIEGLL